MNNKTTEHNPGASETTRFFCTQISSAAGAAGELKQQKERSPTWAKEIPIHGRGNVPVAHNHPNQAISKIAQ